MVYLLITVTLHERQCVPNRRPLDYFLNGLFMLILKKISNPCIAALSERKSLANGIFSVQMSIEMEKVFMTWRVMFWDNCISRHFDYGCHIDGVAVFFLWIYNCVDVLVMMTSSNGNIFRVNGLLCGEFTGPGEFPTQRPVTRSFDVFFDLRLNKRLSKQPWGWWFETPSLSLWRHYNGCTQNRLSCHQLTHWRRNRMIFILQTTYSNAQYWMSIFGFWFQFHWNLLLVFQITIESKLVQALAPIQASTWTNFDQDLRRNMVSKCHND